MSDAGQGADPQGPIARVHFLDVGRREYGDAVLCLLGKKSVLIDGAHPGDQDGSPGHPSLPAQLRLLLGQPQGAVKVDLLIVTHAHQDHIGCLPTLVADGTLQARWALVADPGFGWGRPADGSGPLGPQDARVRSLVAGLREEVLADSSDDQELSRFLADAAALEQRYGRMLTTLAEKGTRVVRYGRDDHKALVRAFRPVGMRILGPSVDQLVLCAEAVAHATDAVESLAADLFRQDAGASEMDVYRGLAGSGIDALDASDRPGPAINLQSIVTRFEFGGVKLLFAGDMQFADPQVGDRRIRAEVGKLRGSIARQAPFSLVKISHHGSDNAFSAETLAELGDTKLFGICAGEESSKHPNATVLRLLDSERNRLDWVRTDRNGLSTVVFGGDRPVLEVTSGRSNDPTPNAPDVMTPPAPEVRVERMSPGTTGAGGDVVEVVTRLPHTATRVQVTIEVQPGGAARLPPARPSVGVPGSWSIAGGRTLPRLLFVTSRDALSESIGVDETARLLDAFASQSLELFDELPRQPLDSTHAQELVRDELRRRGDMKGVVLVGGYDVVPSRVIDCLPASLREQLGQTSDPDDFIVWSDDGFGDLDGGLIPDIPVSRVPDGRSPELLFAALGASDRVPAVARKGVVNIARPFARPIFDALPGIEEVLVSAPLTFDQEPTPTLDAERVYIMLHGDFFDASRFWGEGTPGNREAVNLTSIPNPCGRVVFTGCCWGALTVDQPAVRALPGAAPAQKTPSASIALTFLRNGATAFVGCTGAHYSPTDAPFGYFGGPMHEAFWQHAATSQPAQALLAAKIAFVGGFPHGRTTPLQQAIEYKILHQYTCLGLGW